MRKLAGRVLSMTVLWTAVAMPTLAEGCFRTADEAAAGAGVRDGEGFRLEGIVTDRLAGSRWATVRSCLHPERPGTLLKLMGMAAPVAGTAVQAVARMSAASTDHAPDPLSAVPLLHAGQVVQVLHVERSARLLMGGVAQANAVAGARVRVRLAAPAGVEGAPERFAEGLVRADGVVELEVAQ